MCNTVFRKIPRKYAYCMCPKRPQKNNLNKNSRGERCPYWSFPHLFPPSSVKPSPSKKSRSGVPGGLRRAPTLGGPTPLSHATGQSGGDSRLVYHSHFRSTDSEADSGKGWHITGEMIKTLSWWILSMISLIAELRVDTLVLKNALILFCYRCFALRRAVRQTRSCSEDPSAGR